MKSLFHNILNELLTEQENTNQEVFTPDQQKFLGKFAEKNSQSLGILYSTSPEGIEEFICICESDAFLLNEHFMPFVGFI